MANNIKNINWIGLYTFISREVGRMFRVWIQTLGAPWSSALLYILIFGHVIGSRISSIGGVSYIDFVIPGLVMMNMMTSAFAHTSSSVYFAKWIRSIDEILVAPFSYFEMILGFMAGGVTRAVIVGLGVYILGIFFTSASIAHFWLMLFYIISISTIFSFLGMLVALWSKNFEQLSVPSIFLITPLTFLGGVFNSIYMMPAGLQWIVRINPFFYFVDGLRCSMIGVCESSFGIGLGIITALILGLGYLVWYLFKIGWRIRE
ncbi:MAG: ABC transporter permease [Patescibacteria group bacterium]